jgi:DNA-binding NtrC family response regulator
MNNGTEKYFKRVHLNRLDVVSPAPDGVDIIKDVQEITQKISAQVIDMTDNALIDAIVKAAYKEGVNDLFLIDKEFIISAIKHEMDFRKGVRDK